MSNFQSQRLAEHKARQVAKQKQNLKELLYALALVSLVLLGHIIQAW